MIRTYSQVHATDKFSPHSSIVWPVFAYQLSGCGFESRSSHLNFKFRACSEQGVLDIKATTECGFNLKRVSDMIRTYSQMDRTDKYSHHCSIIWLVWLNVWAFASELSGCGLAFRCSHLKFRIRACFEQGVPWHSGNYRVWIHSEARTWYDRNIESNASYR